jgi:hypothetical protein
MEAKRFGKEMTIDEREKHGRAWPRFKNRDRASPLHRSQADAVHTNLDEVGVKRRGDAR